MCSKQRSLPRSKRATNENFRKQKETFLQKANRLKRDYDADCYILIRRNGRFYTYTSIDQPSWPPNPQDLEKFYPAPVKKTPAHFNQVKEGRPTKANSILH
ncbi:uncharacterized protein K441DRAFT_666611 [Cenococcum geophilum 1.58]|uniref:uncharacterized protein n=1 Tax=Cenococcum geophilum 1.58 TaxID=794803 RepID=UPI00358E6A15|nr:hypothetical protein K441DRAFT_666611 [Cenococcum geophilum 1.58]